MNGTAKFPERADFQLESAALLVLLGQHKSSLQDPGNGISWCQGSEGGWDLVKGIYIIVKARLSAMVLSVSV